MSKDSIERTVLKLNFSSAYTVYKILSKLHESVGDSEFGYRVQGLFAHALMPLGIKISEIKPQGHPDIIGVKGNYILKFEVEAKLSDYGKMLVDQEDLVAIRPVKKNERGYIAILYCKFPPEWLIIDYNRLRWRAFEEIPVIIIRSLSDKTFSGECTEYFYKLILSNGYRISKFTFHFLSYKALKGETL